MFVYRLFMVLVCCLLSLSLSAKKQESYRAQIIIFENNMQIAKNLIQENWQLEENIFRHSMVMSNMSNDDLYQLEQNGLSLNKLTFINSKLILALQLLKDVSKKEIEIEDIDVKPSICSGATVVEVYTLKIIKTLALEILSAAKWGCRDEAFGENFALLCLSAEEHAHLAESAVEIASVCLSAKRNAREDALLETIHGIAEHLNDNLDTPVSTRTSTAQVTEVINDSIAINQTLDDTLPIQLPNIQNALDNLLQNLSENGQKLIDLQTRTTDLVQRQQLNNAQSIDIDQRIADLDLLLAEIRIDTQNMKQQLISLNDLFQQQANHQQLDTGHMSWAMSEQLGKNIVAYQLPNSYGGQLENIRELVAQSISNASSAGISTTQAQAYFDDGDNAYNISSYRLAYTNYANAFRQLGTINEKTITINGEH